MYKTNETKSLFKIKRTLFDNKPIKKSKRIILCCFWASQSIKHDIHVFYYILKLSTKELYFNYYSDEIENDLNKCILVSHVNNRTVYIIHYVVYSL